MLLRIEFETDAEEFQEGGVAEVIRIVRGIQDELLSGGASGTIADMDNNRIGDWEYSN